MITIATSRDNAAVRAVECLLCDGLELDQQAQRIPSFTRYSPHFMFRVPGTLFVVRRNEQLPSFYNINTHAHMGTYYCKIHDKSLNYD